MPASGNRDVIKRRNARAIRKLPFVTVLAPVRAVGDKGRGWQASLSCYGCQEF